MTIGVKKLLKDMKTGTPNHDTPPRVIEVETIATCVFTVGALYYGSTSSGEEGESLDKHSQCSPKDCNPDDATHALKEQTL